MLSGARRLAVMLLLTLLTTATAWAQTSMGFSMDPDIPEGTVGHYYLNMPKTGSATVNIPVGVQSFMVYDDGGKDGNYSDDCSGTLVLTAPENYVMHLSGSASIASNDNLTVWDGTDTNNESKKLLNAVSSFSHPVTSTGNTMTIYFFSNVVNTAGGLNLTVTLAK